VPAPMAALFDLEITERGDGEVRARVPVTDSLKQPLGLVHGGVFASIADALAVGATDGALRALSNQASFLRPVTGGTIHATARRRHQGRTTAVWEVDLADDAGRLCALVRVTVAVGGYASPPGGV
jgi:1,4-dihydroxy-2-naphthoyl-CoA hydrolase